MSWLEKRLVEMNSFLVADAIDSIVHESGPGERLMQPGWQLIIPLEFPPPVTEGIQRNLCVFVNFRDGISRESSVRETSEDRLQLQELVDLRISLW
jgi:hypothetical protein